jgi:hypothetical protein
MTVTEYHDIVNDICFVYNVDAVELSDKVYKLYIHTICNWDDERDYPTLIKKYIEYAENKEKEAIEK